MRSSLLFVAAGLSASLGCGLSPEITNPMVLRVYDAPKGQAARIRESLKDVLWQVDGKDVGHAIGRVDNLPNNQLLVLAPKRVQEGVAKVIDDATSHPYPDEKTTELRYWLVVGKPNPKAGAPSASTPEIQPALEAIIREGGPQDLSVVQTARVASFTNNEGKVEAAKLKVRQTATSEGATVWASIDIDLAGNNLAQHDSKLNTRVRLIPGQTIVIGASGYGDANDGSVLYYLVRAVAPLGT
jgi:hypothetical protein